MDLSPGPSITAVAQSQPAVQLDAPIEQNSAVVERAIYELACAAALSGVQYSDLTSLWPHGMPSTSLGRLVVNPISQACLHAQVVLAQHLVALLGESEGDARIASIQARVFAEVERPLALADATFH